jgi:hypothetical protein
MQSITVARPRRDKKREIKATLPRRTRSVLEQRAAVAGLSPMAYAARLSLAALDNETVIRALSPYFRRGYCRGSRAWIGRVIAPSLEPLLPEGDDVTRFAVKFAPEDHLQIGEVAYALSCSLSQALTILLSEALLQGVEVPAADRKAVQ